MDNAMEIFRAHMAEYGPSFSFVGYGYMLRVYMHIWNAATFERLIRA